MFSGPIKLFIAAAVFAAVTVSFLSKDAGAPGASDGSAKSLMVGLAEQARRAMAPLFGGQQSQASAAVASSTSQDAQLRLMEAQARAREAQARAIEAEARAEEARSREEVERHQSVAMAQPQPRAPSGYGLVELVADRGGHYHADVSIDGSPVSLLVDTGATLVSLSNSEARRLGYSPRPDEYKYITHTANGDARVAVVTLREIRIDLIVVRNVQALVMPPDNDAPNLLGMSFLKNVSMTSDGGKLVLRP